ncbi:hypothetical protein WME76_28080 [Sorangium sp. So ce119]|uniref:hypothetical protein n=1 Tax=Sorangium sp. So ce119 TaxID=3133279 RepID=UPI003F5F40C4
MSACVTLDEVLAAAHARCASLVPETSGYLALAVSDATSRLPLRLDDRAVLLTTEGTVTVRTRGEPVAPAEAARLLRDLLARLLAASAGSMPNLATTARPRPASEQDPDAVARELEAALIPVNRNAARRALARLARETLRAKEAGRLKRARPAAQARPAALEASEEAAPAASAARAPTPGAHDEVATRGAVVGPRADEAAGATRGQEASAARAEVAGAPLAPLTTAVVELTLSPGPVAPAVVELTLSPGLVAIATSGQTAPAPAIAGDVAEAAAASEASGLPSEIAPASEHATHIDARVEVIPEPTPTVVQAVVEIEMTGAPAEIPAIPELIEPARAIAPVAPIARVATPAPAVAAVAPAEERAAPASSPLARDATSCGQALTSPEGIEVFLVELSPEPAGVVPPSQEPTPTQSILVEFSPEPAGVAPLSQEPTPTVATAVWAEMMVPESAAVTSRADAFGAAADAPVDVADAFGAAADAPADVADAAADVADAAADVADAADAPVDVADAFGAAADAPVDVADAFGAAADAPANVADAAADVADAADAPVDVAQAADAPADAPVDVAHAADAPVDVAHVADAPADAPVDVAHAADAPGDVADVPADAPADAPVDVAHAADAPAVAADVPADAVETARAPAIHVLLEAAPALQVTPAYGGWPLVQRSDVAAASAHSRASVAPFEETPAARHTLPWPIPAHRADDAPGAPAPAALTAPPPTSEAPVSARADAPPTNAAPVEEPCPAGLDPIDAIVWSASRRSRSARPPADGAGPSRVDELVARFVAQSEHSAQRRAARSMKALAGLDPTLTPPPVTALSAISALAALKQRSPLTAARPPVPSESAALGALDERSRPPAPLVAPRRRGLSLWLALVALALLCAVLVGTLRPELFASLAEPLARGALHAVPRAEARTPPPHD